MNFGEALQALKDGFKVKRAIWGGYWYLAKNVSIRHDPVAEPEGRDPVVCDIVSYTADSMIVAVLKDDGGHVPAMPYQNDLLSEDWLIVD